MSAPKEIERKFWLRQLPSFISELPSTQIKQGYLALNPEGQEVRLRKNNNTYWLTVKSDGGIERSEYEISLSPQQFEALWPAVEEQIILKTRYLWEKDSLQVEIDVYHQPLEGLIVAEVEFQSREDAQKYIPEPWMSKDITHLNFLKNKNLLQYQSFEQIKSQLFN